MASIDRINPLYAFIFSVFRLGQSTERSYLDSFLSPDIIKALLKTGLLVQKRKYYSMPQVGILPLGGMYFVTGLPDIYPTVLRNNQYKPVDHSVWMIRDEIISQPVGESFLEFRSDYGILANIAAVKGFKNIQVYPNHPDNVPFIQINLALNHNKGEVVTDCTTKEYDLIACIFMSVMRKLESRNRNISDERDIIKSFSIFHQLKETGYALFLLESVGTIGKITVNGQLREMDGFNIQSVVLNKMPYLSFLIGNNVQSSWEKQFEILPREYEDYTLKMIKSSDGKVFVFTQLLKINRESNGKVLLLYPFYNPKYSDPVYNYASLTV